MYEKECIEMNGHKFSVSFKKGRNLIWASTYVNGKEVKKHGDDYQTAYWV